MEDVGYQCTAEGALRPPPHCTTVGGGVVVGEGGGEEEVEEECCEGTRAWGMLGREGMTHGEGMPVGRRQMSGNWPSWLQQMQGVSCVACW